MSALITYGIAKRVVHCLHAATVKKDSWLLYSSLAPLQDLGSLGLAAQKVSKGLGHHVNVINLLQINKMRKMRKMFTLESFSWNSLTLLSLSIVTFVSFCWRSETFDFVSSLT